MEWNRIGSARLHTVVDAYKIQCSICFYVPIPQCVNLVLDSSRFDCLIYCLNEKCGICCDSKMCVFADEIRFDYKFYFCVMSSLVFFWFLFTCSVGCILFVSQLVVAILRAHS